MKQFALSFFLFFLILPAGFILGKNNASSSDAVKNTQEIRNNYASSQGELEDNQKSTLLTVWKNGKWEKYLPTEQDKSKKTYVLSHGLNAEYDGEWITNSAEAIQEQFQNTKDKDNILILSVNWDKYSGTSDSKNFLASTWIDPVSDVLAEQLDGYNVKSYVGHSYGAHLLASTIEKVNPTQKTSFVALDPAEEQLTLNGSGLVDNMKKISRQTSYSWNLPSTVVSESYKSSVFLGTEETYADYNYVLAKEGSITPKAVLGDMDSGLVSNHSEANIWFSKTVGQRFGEYSDEDLIGGWYNQEVDADRTTREGGDGYDGLVNSTKSYDQGLEFTSGNHEYTSWGELTNTSAALKVLAQEDWDNTVFNPDAKNNFIRYQKNFISEVAAEYLEADSVTVDDDGVVSYKTEDGSTVRLDPDDGSKTLTLTDGSSYKLDSEGNLSQQGSDGTLVQIEQTAVQTSWYDTAMDYIEQHTFLNGDSDGYAFSGDSFTDAVDGVVDQIISDAESAAKEALTQGGQKLAQTALDAISTVITTGKFDTSQIISGLKQSWDVFSKTITQGIKNIVSKVLSLKTLENIANWGLDKLLSLNPTLKTIFSKLGLDNIKNLVGLCQDLFNMVKGLFQGQKFMDLLRNSATLKMVMKNAISWGLDLLSSLLSQWLEGLLSKIGSWLDDLVSKITSALGIKTSTDFGTVLNNAAQSGMNAGKKWFLGKVDAFLEPTNNSNNAKSNEGTIKKDGYETLY